MPTIHRVGGLRFFFYSNEAGEAPHVHVQRAGGLAKFWLKPVSCARSSGFRRHELNWIEQVVRAEQTRFLGAWYAYFAF